jgi:Flp pilus assembly protein TadG
MTDHTTRFPSRRCLARRTDGEQGAAAVEFALLAPIFIMIVFGIISFGLVFAQQLGLSNGARQGARTGVVKGITCAQIYADAQDASGTVGMGGSSVTVAITRGATAAAATNPCGSTPATSTTQPCSGSTAGDSVYVKTSYTSQLIIPPIIFKSSYPINATGAYECEFH